MYKGMRNKLIFKSSLLAAIWVFSLFSPGSAQTIKLVASDSVVAADDGVRISVRVQGGQDLAGVGVSIVLPEGVYLAGPPSQEVGYVDGWSVSIIPSMVESDSEMILRLAAAKRVNDAACDAEIDCEVARFVAFSSERGPKSFRILRSETRGVSLNEQNVTFTQFRDETVRFGAGIPGDIDGDGRISNIEASTAVTKWLRGDSDALSNIELSQIVTIWLGGPCYEVDAQGHPRAVICE